MKTLSPELQEKFLNIATALSPENLSCDGELPRNRIAVRRRTLMEEWRKLEVDAGRKVTEDEVWDAEIARKNKEWEEQRLKKIKESEWVKV